MGNCGSTNNANKNKVKNIIDKEADKAKNAAHDIKNDVKKDIKEEGKEVKKEVQDKIKNEADHGKDQAKQHIDNAKDQAKQQIDNTKDQAKAEINHVKGEVIDAKDVILNEKEKVVNDAAKFTDNTQSSAAEINKRIKENKEKVHAAFSVKKNTTKKINFVNTTTPQVNYSALQVTKYFHDQQPYHGEEKYTDPFFPPNRNSLFGLLPDGSPLDKDEARREEAQNAFQINEDDIVWLRPEEIFGNEYALFEGKIEFDDVRQGSIGNCYFMASISALTECPQIIAEIFRVLDVQKNGCYEVCLKIDGEWNVVILDDFFPCSKTSKKPIFAKSKGNELWAILLEKAWAKVNGGYINTVAGMASEVIECLTNFPYEYNQTSEALDSEDAKQALWEKIMYASKTDYIMTTALPQRDGAKELGLVEGHEYTLEEGKEVVYKGENLRLLKIRNPWGSINYKGAWGQNYEHWDDKLKELFDYKAVYDGEGEFLMDFDTFLTFFADVDICKIKDRICLKQAKITYNTENDNAPRLFEIHVYEKTDLDITIFKPYYRFVKNLPSDYTYNQHMLLAKCEDKNNFEFSHFWGSTEGQNDCTLSVSVTEGTYFLYAYVDFHSAKDGNGNDVHSNIFKGVSSVVSVYSSEFFDFKEHGADPNMSMFHRMIVSYNKKNTPEEENGFSVRADNNFFKSEFSYFYIKNLNDKVKDVKFDFSANVKMKALSESSSANLNSVVTLNQNQEHITLFTCCDIYDGHGLGYSYSSRNSKKTGPDHLPRLVNLEECSGEACVLSSYKWLYKKTDIDYSNIIKKIDVSDAAFKHLKAYYIKEIEEIEQVPKFENHEELKLEVQDKTDFGGGDWYLGEWKTEEGQYQMWGRGMCFLQGIKFIGQFSKHAMNGYGTMIQADGSKMQGKFEDFQPKGEILYTHNDGKVEKLQY